MKTVLYFLMAIGLAAACTIGFCYYCFGYWDSRGLAFCSSLQSNTDSLAAWNIESIGNRPVLNEAGIRQLDAMNGSIQILDLSGEILYQYDSRTGKIEEMETDPARGPERLSMAQLLDIARNPALPQGSRFVSTAAAGGNEYVVICRFDQAVSMSEIYYNSKHISRLSLLIWLVPAFLLPILAVYVIRQQVLLHRIQQKIALIRQREASSQIVIGFPYEKVDMALKELETQIEQSEELIRVNKQLQQEWIEGVSHDLKTPLSPIKGYAQLLQDHPHLGWDVQSRYIKSICKNSLIMEQRIEDLKLAYQIEGGRMPLDLQKINIERIVRETVIDFLNNPEYENRKISYRYEKNSPLIIMADGKLIRRAIENVLANCLIHNDENTSVTVELYSETDRAILVMRDDGQGIPDEEIDHIFERRYQVLPNGEKRPSGGHEGLGLYIARQIMVAHKGTIQARSSDPNGTSFIFEIPLFSS